VDGAALAGSALVAQRAQASRLAKGKGQQRGKGQQLLPLSQEGEANHHVRTRLGVLLLHPLNDLVKCSLEWSGRLHLQRNQCGSEPERFPYVVFHSP
jgi:hypothetical protein